MFHDFVDDETRRFRPYRGSCRRCSDSSHMKCTECANYDPNNKNRPLSLVTEKGNDNNCCNGFMGYYDHPHIWSDCSMRYFREEFVSKNWSKCMTCGKFPYRYSHFLC